MHAPTLRKITDAMAKLDPGFDTPEDARQNYYDRGRMLRDRGLIRSSVETQQGRTTVFSEADTVSAAVMISANRDGESWAILKIIHGALRPFDGTEGYPAFETHLQDIKKGVDVTIRVDMIRQPFCDHPGFNHPEVRVQMSASPSPPDVTSTRTISYNATALAKPILDYLVEHADQ